MITIIAIVVIIVAFVYYASESWKLFRAYRIIAASATDDAPLSKLSETKFSDIAASYSETINIIVGEGKRTNVPSSEFFSSQAIAQKCNMNLKALDSASGTLVGFGLLGTFLGLTIGIDNLDTSSSDNIQNSIGSLLGGMSTAFLTSLIGMGASLLYTLFIDKPIRNRFVNALAVLNRELDNNYYIDDVALLSLRQKEELYNVQEKLRTDIGHVFEAMHQETTAINKKMSFTNDDGYDVPIGNAIRDMLDESRQQTASLASFSTDLATSFNNLIGDTLEDRIRQQMLPLMNKIIEHIDQMASTVVKPSNEMMTTVATELKESMTQVVEEFRQRVADVATQQLESLSQSLDTASKAMDVLPENVSNASTQLQEILTKMQRAMLALSEDIVAKQTDLLALQETTTEETKHLLQTLNDGLARLEAANDSYTNTIEQLQHVQGQIAGSTELLNGITSDMKTATETFQRGQEKYAEHIEELQEKNQNTISSVSSLVERSGQLSSDYAEQFGVIRQGLADIFEQLQKGLQEYSKTVQESLNSYLEEYSKSHNAATEALSSNIEMLSEVVDEFGEVIKKNK